MKNEILEKAKDTVAKDWGYEDITHAIYGDRFCAAISAGNLLRFIDNIAITYADSQLTQILESIESKQYEYVNLLRNQVVNIHDIRNIFAEYGIKLEPKF